MFVWAQAVLGQAQAEQAVELARRVRALEGKVASLQQRADDAGVDLSLRVGALEWRLDKVRGMPYLNMWARCLGLAVACCGTVTRACLYSYRPLQVSGLLCLA